MPRHHIERTIEKGLFASRWLMAPFYMGLVLAVMDRIAYGQKAH